jgi:formylglycine-generating enzyme required for sulfatase activity
MSGNVWEWVQDAWHTSYRGAPSSAIAWEDGGIEDRVLRGGSWINSAESLRVSARFTYSPGSRFDTIGFRCARTGSNP